LLFSIFVASKNPFMKISLSKLNVFALLLSGGALFAQPEETQADFVYSVEDVIKRTDHFRFEIDAAALGYHGKHLSLGIGGRIVAHHFVDKLSAEANFLFRHRAGLLKEQQIGFSQNENLNEFRGQESGFLLTYSFSKKLAKKDQFVTLNESRSVKTVSKLPTTFFRLMDIRLGMVFYDLPSQLTFKSDAIYNNNLVYFMQRTRSLSLGVSFKTLQHDIFETNVFGKVTQSNYGDLFVDLLFGLSPSFPGELYQTFYAENNSMNEPNSFSGASEIDYDNIRDGLKYNRLGAQIGYRSGKMRRGLGATLAVGYRPGFYSDAERGYLDNITANLTIAYHFVVKKK